MHLKVLLMIRHTCISVHTDNDTEEAINLQQDNTSKSLIIEPQNEGGISYMSVLTEFSMKSRVTKVISRGP